MIKRDRIYVAPIMKLAFESERNKLAAQIKREHGLTNITIPDTGISELLGRRILDSGKTFQFKIRKTGLNSGVIEFI